MTIDPELIREIGKEFAEFISRENNTNILFSGKYGKGKTTFLNHFFENQKNYSVTCNYNFFFLDPVHYSISANDDIVQYIKHDILINLVQKIKIDKISLSTKDIAQHYIASHPEKIVKSIISYVPKVGELLENCIDKLEDLYVGIKELKKEAEEKNDFAKVTNFLKRIGCEPTSAYQSDSISILINSYINRLKETSGKETVLIIDNMDRIDPEHIFRILNIFSAHLSIGHSNLNNSFGFDKIILVCDIENIRSIFHHRYGDKADFAGYIDKFYTAIFYYHNYPQIQSAVYNLLSNSLVKTGNGYVPLKTIVEKNDHGIFDWVSFLVFSNQVSLRSVVNYVSTGAFDGTIKISSESNVYDITRSTPLLELMILTKIMGGYNSLKKALAYIEEHELKLPNFKKHYHQLMFFYLRKVHKYELQNGEKSFDTKIDIIGDVQSFKISVEQRQLKFMTIYMTGNVPIPFTPKMKDFLKLFNTILSELYTDKVLE